MKVVVGKTTLRQVLKWAQGGLFAAGILILGYCGFVLLDTWRFERAETQSLERLSRTSAVAPAPAPAIGPDGLIGRIEIQRLGVSAVVVEGTGGPALRRATGHIKGTGFPGQPGNIGIAGHRDTFFRPLQNIQRDDIITLTTAGGEYRYRVVSMNVVNPTDVAVLDPDGHEILTLVTCYPFHFIGSAPNRFIVRAERVA